MIQLSQQGDDVLLPVKVVPKSSRDKIVGELDGALKITVAAAPEKGAANDAVAIWKHLPDEARTPVRRDELMRLWVRGEVGRLTNVRAAEAARSGNPGPEGSVSKLEFAIFNQHLYDFCVDLMGLDGQVGYDYTFRRPTELDATGVNKGIQYAFMRVRANSIEGGTSEVLKNIIGERVLGLPGDVRVDKDLPWKDVPRS